MNRAEVAIRTPCGADWDKMDPRGSARFCGQCDKLVHDLSALGERAARQLLQSKPESLCVRYLHDATGQIWFGSERDPVPTAGLNRKKRNLAAAALVAATPVLIQACGGADPWAIPPPNEYGYRADAGTDAEADAPDPGLSIDASPGPQTDAPAPTGDGGTSGDPDSDAGAAGSR